MVTVGDELGGHRKDLRPLSKRFERFQGLFQRPVEFKARSLYPDERHQRCLAGAVVLGDGLADPLGITLCVEQVISDLKGKAQMFPKLTKCRSVRHAGSGQNGTCFTGKADEPARLQRLQGDDVSDV